MEFEWSFKQKTFRESMRKFAGKEVNPGIIERDEKGEFNWGLRKPIYVIFWAKASGGLSGAHL